MYDDIVDYDDFSERVGSENDILDLIYDEIWKKTYCPKWLMTELKINSYNTVWHMANKVKTVANHSPKDKCIFRELEKIFRRHRFI